MERKKAEAEDETEEKSKEEAMEKARRRPKSRRGTRRRKRLHPLEIHCNFRIRRKLWVNTLSLFQTKRFPQTTNFTSNEKPCSRKE